MLTLATERQITQREAARELVLSLPHTERLVRKLRKAGGSSEEGK
jgi:DNA-binding IscR family transcriptional regulator